MRAVRSGNPSEEQSAEGHLLPVQEEAKKDRQQDSAQEEQLIHREGVTCYTKPMSKSLAETNHEFLTATLALKDTIETAFLVLAERLLKIRNELLYQVEYESFEDFLTELKVSRSTAYKIMAVYEKFVLLGEIEPQRVAEAGWGSLCLFAGSVSSKAMAIEVFDRIAHLSRSDALKELVELHTGVPQISCSHADSYEVKICRTCGVKMRIYDEPIE